MALVEGIRNREAKWRLYVDLFPIRPTDRILDVGASAQVELPGENYFLAAYPYPHRVTAVALHVTSELRDRFPDVTFVQGDGRALPFESKQFDVAHSNAVIEHVGDRDAQRQFVAELSRVARHVFITTPNRWFPLEAHSRLP